MNLVAITHPSRFFIDDFRISMDDVVVIDDVSEGQTWRLRGRLVPE